MAVWSVPNLGLKCWKFGTVLGSPGTDFGLLLVHMCFLCVKLWLECLGPEMAESFRSSGVGPNVGNFGQFRIAHIPFRNC